MLNRIPFPQNDALAHAAPDTAGTGHVLLRQLHLHRGLSKPDKTLIDKTNHAPTEATAALVRAARKACTVRAANDSRTASCRYLRCEKERSDYITRWEA